MKLSGNRLMSEKLSLRKFPTSFGKFSIKWKFKQFFSILLKVNTKYMQACQPSRNLLRKFPNLKDYSCSQFSKIVFNNPNSYWHIPSLIPHFSAFPNTRNLKNATRPRGLLVSSSYSTSSHSRQHNSLFLYTVVL